MSNLTPERFSNRFWDLGDVLGWIADRDPVKFGRIVSVHDLPPLIFRVEPVPPEEGPEEELLRALQDGNLVAYDLAEVGENSRINADFWLFKNRGDIRGHIGRVSFRRNDVLQVWHEPAVRKANEELIKFELPAGATPGDEQCSAEGQGASKAKVAGATIVRQHLDLPRDAVPIPNKPGRGGNKKAAAVAAMIKAVEGGVLTFSELRRMKQKELDRLYSDAKRTMLQEARTQALSQLADLGYSDKAPT